MRQLQQVPPQQQAFTRLNAAENYRRNFQSPPTPRVLSQFEVRRDGDRVVVVDEDGSVYEGQVIEVATLAAEQQRQRVAAPFAGGTGQVARAARSEREAVNLVQRNLGVQSGVSQNAAFQNAAAQNVNASNLAAQTFAGALFASPNAAPAGGGESGGFYFRATGVNRSSSERVVFTGEVRFDGRGVEQLEKQAESKSQAELLVAARGLVFTNQFRSSGGDQSGPLLGRVTGRARVGARDELQIDAVSRKGAPPQQQQLQQR